MLLGDSDQPLPADERGYVRAMRAAPTAAEKPQTYAAALARLMPRLRRCSRALRDGRAHRPRVRAGAPPPRRPAVGQHAAPRRRAASHRRAAPRLDDDDVADLVWSTNSPEWFTLVSSRGWSTERYGAVLADLWCRTLLADPPRRGAPGASMTGRLGFGPPALQQQRVGQDARARARPGAGPRWRRGRGCRGPRRRSPARSPGGRRSRNSAMNGIEPPTPMSTGSTPPQASANAARAASYAGPVASMAVASPVSTRVTSSWAPQGTCCSRCALEPGQRVGQVSPGATRMETLARADGTRVLEAPSTLGASMPVIDSEGLVQSRSTALPLPDPLDARRDAALGAKPRLGVVHVGSGTARRVRPRRRCPRRRGGWRSAGSGPSASRGRDRPTCRSGPRGSACGPRRRPAPARAERWSAREPRCPSCRSRR